MDRTESALLFAVVLVVASVALALSVLSISTHNSFGRMTGGMMEGTSEHASPGGIEWTVLLGSTLLFFGSIALLLRARRLPSPIPTDAPIVGPRTRPQAHVGVDIRTDDPSPVPEMTLVKLLDEDERRMYLEIRERGGELLQRDLVALGTFSKSKVTRVLDKLERKGLVVRERHGMTNRVRLVTRGSR